MGAISSRSRGWILVWLSALLSLSSAERCFGNQTIGNSSQRVDNFFEVTCSGIDYTGNLTIESILWPSPKSILHTSSNLSLGNLQHVYGSLELENIRMQQGIGYWTIDGSKLAYVDNSLSFTELAQFKMPEFSALSIVGTLAFHNVTVNSPTPFNFTQQWPALNQVTTIELVNTSLVSFGPFHDELSPVQGNSTAYISIIDNSALTRVEINGYSGVPTNVVVRDNSDALSVSFPQLSQAVVSISGVNDIFAPLLNTLGSVDDPSTVQTISNNHFEGLSLRGLTYIVGTLEIENNERLQTLDLRRLNSIYSLKLDNNTLLRDISLPALQAVDVNLYINGPIDSIDAPRAKGVNGNVTIMSWGKLDCSNLDITQAIGKPTCVKIQGPSTVQGPKGPTTSGFYHGSPSGGSGPGGNGGLSTGAKVGIGVGVGVGVLAIAALIFFFWCCARRSKKRSPRSAAAGQYYMPEAKGVESSATRYTKVPAVSGSTEERSSVEEVTPSSRLGDNWYPPEQHVPTTDGRVELEEQQRPRHEMDARSLQDIDLDDDREETRSFEDIERAHLH